MGWMLIRYIFISVFPLRQLLQDPPIVSVWVLTPSLQRSAEENRAYARCRGPQIAMSTSRVEWTIPVKMSLLPEHYQNHRLEELDVWSEEQGMHPAWEREGRISPPVRNGGESHHKINITAMKKDGRPQNHWSGKSCISKLEGWRSSMYSISLIPFSSRPAWRGSGY